MATVEQSMLAISASLTPVHAADSSDNSSISNISSKWISARSSRVLPIRGKFSSKSGTCARKHHFDYSGFEESTCKSSGRQIKITKPKEKHRAKARKQLKCPPGYIVDEFSGKERKRNCMDDFHDTELPEKRVYRHLLHWQAKSSALMERIEEEGDVDEYPSLISALSKAEKKAAEAQALLEALEGEDLGMD
jgi:hypothetical protein